MTMSDRSTVVGVFHERTHAEQAIGELQRIGITDDQIGFVVRGDKKNEGYVTPDSEVGERAAIGAVGGGVVGGLIGAAASLMIPGLGPAIAGGILATTLSGVILGAAAGGIIGALTKMGVPEEEAQYYQGEFESGRTIVTVEAPGRQQDAINVLRSHGAYDASTRQPSYSSTERQKYSSDRTDYAPDDPGYNKPGY